VLLRVQEVDFTGLVAVSAGDEKGQRSGPGEISPPSLHRCCAIDEPLLRSNHPRL
jgi:hypothetical protein